MSRGVLPSLSLGLLTPARPQGGAWMSEHPQSIPQGGDQDDYANGDAGGKYDYLRGMLTLELWLDFQR